jgi:hypothetical protein
MYAIINSQGVFCQYCDESFVPSEGFEKIQLSENDINLLQTLFVKKRIENQWIEGATQEEIQQQELEQKKILKQQQYEELLPTDWYVVRFIETGIPVPEEILQQRQAIREKYN